MAIPELHYPPGACNEGKQNDTRRGRRNGHTRVVSPTPKRSAKRTVTSAQALHNMLQGGAKGCRITCVGEGRALMILPLLIPGRGQKYQEFHVPFPRPPQSTTTSRNERNCVVPVATYRARWEKGPGNFRVPWRALQSPQRGRHLRAWRIALLHFVARRDEVPGISKDRVNEAPASTVQG